jgi:hypothetical protein
MTQEVAQLVKVVEQLPVNKIVEVVDFAKFLAWQETAETDDKQSFFLWAEELARKHGFDHLTEDDVAQIVHEFRQEK